MTDPTRDPDLELIVNAMAPAVLFRAEVEEVIEQYVGARREAAIAEERSAGMKETRCVIADVNQTKQELWALLDCIPWPSQ